MAEQWMSIAAAATALGTEESVVRRLIAENQIAIRAGVTGLEVLITPPPAPTPTAAASTPAPVAAATPPAVGRDTVFEAMLASEADEDDDAWPHSTSTAKPAAAAPPVSPRLGRYAPLPTSDVGTPIDAGAQPTRSPLLAAPTADATPSPAPADDAAPDEVTRFQRLAGASLVIAQQRSDEAREQVAFARNEAFRVRKIHRFTLAGASTALVGVLLLTASYAFDASRAEGALLAKQDLIQQAQAEAQQARAEVANAKRENAALVERLEQAEAERGAVMKQLEEQRALILKSEADKRQTETALQAALVSLYQYQPEEARTTIQRLRAEGN